MMNFWSTEDTRRRRCLRVEVVGSSPTSPTNLFQKRGKEMWGTIEKYLIGFPSQRKVVRFLLENGFSVKNGKIFCNEICVPATSIARALDVDRRTVVKAINTIEENQELSRIFIHIRNAGLSMDKIAKRLGLQVIEITASDASAPGILAGVASTIAEVGISIRQAVADDPELAIEPRLIIICDKKIPGELIDKFLKVKGVAKVTIY